MELKWFNWNQKLTYNFSSVFTVPFIKEQRVWKHLGFAEGEGLCADRVKQLAGVTH